MIMADVAAEVNDTNGIPKTPVTSPKSYPHIPLNTDPAAKASPNKPNFLFVIKTGTNNVAKIIMQTSMTSMLIYLVHIELKNSCTRSSYRLVINRTSWQFSYIFS